MLVAALPQALIPLYMPFHLDNLACIGISYGVAEYQANIHCSNQYNGIIVFNEVHWIQYVCWLVGD